MKFICWGFFGFCCGVAVGLDQAPLVFLNCAGFIFGWKIFAPAVDWVMERFSR